MDEGEIAMTNADTTERDVDTELSDDDRGYRSGRS